MKAMSMSPCAGRFPCALPLHERRSMTASRTRTFAGGPALLLPAVGTPVLTPGPAAEGDAGHGRADPPPGSFTWSSSGPPIGPKPDAGHLVVSVEGPTVFRNKNRWHLCCTTADTAGRSSLAHTGFARWSEAGPAPHAFLDATRTSATGTAAPQVFHFAPPRTWYMVCRTGPPSCSTTKNPADPMSWSAPKYFSDSEPPIVTEAPATKSGRRRYFRAWTGRRPGRHLGAAGGHRGRRLHPLRQRDLAAGAPARTKDFGHCEMIRDGVGRTLTIGPCRLRFLCHGMDPAAGGDYAQRPCKPGLLPQTNSSC